MKAFLYGTTLFFLLLFSQSSFAQDPTVQYSIANITDATNGLCNGEINVFASQSEGPLTFLWSDGSTDKDATDLCPGTYTVTITLASGCEIILEGTVDGDECTLGSLEITADIVHYCAPGTLGAIEIEIPGNRSYSYAWDDKTPNAELTDLQPGNYCVTITDDDFSSCETTVCYDIINQNCGAGNNSPVVIINEVSNGPTGGEEFVEILVVGDGNCNAVDLGGYILDDNDGTFSADGVGGTGIAPGHIRFAKSQNAWSSIPVGSLILIYNSRDKNALIQAADDPDDSNGDNIYILPANHQYLETNSLYPKSSKPSDYNVQGGDGGYTSKGNWEALGLYEYADAIQIRNPNGEYSHGVSYGIRELMKGGPDELLLTPSNGIGKVFSFEDGDYRNANSYLVASTSKNSETPGYANSTKNALYISNLCSQKSQKNYNTLATTEGSAIFHPNPFNNNINIELDWSIPANVQIRLYDVLGKVVVEEPLRLVKGFNQFNLNVPASVPSGLYQIAICKDNEVLVGQKIICAKTGR